MHGWILGFFYFVCTHINRSMALCCQIEFRRVSSIVRVRCLILQISMCTPSSSLVGNGKAPQHLTTQAKSAGGLSGSIQMVTSQWTSVTWKTTTTVRRL